MELCRRKQMMVQQSIRTVNRAGPYEWRWPGERPHYTVISFPTEEPSASFQQHSPGRGIVVSCPRGVGERMGKSSCLFPGTNPQQSASRSGSAITAGKLPAPSGDEALNVKQKLPFVSLPAPVP